jgi:hypothetical protein
LRGAAGETQLSRSGRVLREVTRSHAVVLELQGTAGTNCFHRRLFVARLVGLIFMQAME